MYIPAAQLRALLRRNPHGPTTLLAIDHGTKRCGLAVSDRWWTSARGLEVLQMGSLNDEQVRQRMAHLCVEHDVAAMVVGWPLLPLGGVGSQCVKVAAFVKSLDMPDMPKVLWDERYSTHAAEEAVMAERDDLYPDMHRKRRRYNKVSLDKESAREILLQFTRAHPF